MSPLDGSWCLTEEDDEGQETEQSEIIDVLKSSIRELAGERGWSRVFVGSDQFFAWLPEEPMVRVSPDVYLLDDPPPPPLPASWQTWREGHRAPRFAVEIVSGDDQHPERWRKDYDQAPQKYAQLGTRELVIFDPQAALGEARDPQRVPLQCYRREADGGFVRVYAGSGPLASVELAAFLVVATDDAVARLRVARDAQGRERVLTAVEARDAALHELAELRVRVARLDGEA